MAELIRNKAKVFRPINSSLSSLLVLAVKGLEAGRSVSFREELKSGISLPFKQK